MRCVFVLLTAILFIATPSARGDDHSVKQQKARALFKQGEELYGKGDYARAIELYEKAYALAPLPLLLFDLAQAYRLNRDPDRAIEHYRRYLDVDPNGRGSPEARQRLAELFTESNAARERAAKAAAEEAAAKRAEEERIASEARAADQSALVASPPQKRPVWKRGWFWGALAGAAVVAGGAITLGVVLSNRDPSHSFGRVAGN